RADPARPWAHAVGREGHPGLRALRQGHRVGLPTRLRARQSCPLSPSTARSPCRRPRFENLGVRRKVSVIVNSAGALPPRSWSPPRDRLGYLDGGGGVVARKVTATSTDRITLAEVAAEAGVSLMTVSRVVNDRPGVGVETRQRVRQAIDSLGYRPNIVARGLKASSSRSIGLLVPDVTNPYFPEIVRGAEDVAIRHGYTLLLTNGIEDQARETLALQTFE